MGIGYHAFAQWIDGIIIVDQYPCIACLIVKGSAFEWCRYGKHHMMQIQPLQFLDGKKDILLGLFVREPNMMLILGSMPCRCSNGTAA